MKKSTTILFILIAISSAVCFDIFTTFAEKNHHDTLVFSGLPNNQFTWICSIGTFLLSSLIFWLSIDTEDGK